MNENYKNSYKSTEKELVSLAVYNVGYQKCNPKYQWGPGIRDHYLIHHIIAGKGRLKVNQTIYDLAAGDSFLIYPDTEASYTADESDPWEYAWVGFNGSDAPILLKATDFAPANPVITNTPYGKEITHQLRHIYEVRGMADGSVILNRKHNIPGNSAISPEHAIVRTEPVLMALWHTLRMLPLSFSPRKTPTIGINAEETPTITPVTRSDTLLTIEKTGRYNEAPI